MNEKPTKIGNLVEKTYVHAMKHATVKPVNERLGNDIMYLLFMRTLPRSHLRSHNKKRTRYMFQTIIYDINSVSGCVHEYYTNLGAY